jgi:hypothetical protein
MRAVFVVVLRTVRGRGAETRTLLGGGCKSAPGCPEIGSLRASISTGMEARNGGIVR